MRKTIGLIFVGLIALAFLATPAGMSPVGPSFTLSSNLQRAGAEVTGTCSFDSFFNPGAHFAVWHWGDGSWSVVNVAAGLTTATATHAYGAPGVYTVDVKVYDDIGNPDTWFVPQDVIVYDPGAGFATGGGWFLQEEAGPMAMSMLAASDSTDSKVTFAFVCNYKKGSSVPMGSAEIHFNGLNFHAGAYDWMMVNGARAQFKGTGSIDGQDGYSFMITVIDGAVTGTGTDLIRIMIWDSQSGYIVFDSQPFDWDFADPTTVNNGGSIVVHNR